MSMLEMLEIDVLPLDLNSILRNVAKNRTAKNLKNLRIKTPGT